MPGIAVGIPVALDIPVPLTIYKDDIGRPIVAETAHRKSAARILSNSIQQGWLRMTMGSHSRIHASSASKFQTTSTPSRPH